MPRLSIIMPVLDEATLVGPALQALAPARARGAEVIVVDGGSRDGTADRARAGADHVFVAPRGRATQMNAGAALARGDVLLFLHVDSRLPDAADDLIVNGLAASGRAWGRFDVTIAGTHRLLPMIATMMNLRSRLSGIATGDQGLFVRRDLFERVGGYPEIPLMEDIALSSRLRRVCRALCLRDRITTSGRRWERHGVLRTILLMWRLRLAYYFGADPARLAQRYGYVPRQS